jgi:hypothetical protein
MNGFLSGRFGCFNALDCVQTVRILFGLSLVPDILWIIFGSVGFFGTWNFRSSELLS